MYYLETKHKENLYLYNKFCNLQDLEIEGWIEKAVFLNSKCYSKITVDKKEEFKMKGVSKKQNSQIRFQHYYNILMSKTNEVYSAVANGIIIKNGKLVTIQSMKSALTAKTIKRKFEDGIHGNADGFNDSPEIKKLRYSSNKK